MICPDLIDDMIDWDSPPDLLSEFLESRLGINKKRLFEDMRQSRVDMSEDEVFHSLESLIQIECTDDRLESIGKYIRILVSLRIVLATRDLYRMSKVKPMSNLGQIATSDKCRADICEFSLRLGWECMIECLCDDEFEYCISEIFESLIGLTISIGNLVEY